MLAMSEPICRCHASDLDGGLLRCPGCGHRRSVPWARFCAWRACAYQGRAASEQGRLR
jgi:hypothetical protein